MNDIVPLSFVLFYSVFHISLKEYDYYNCLNVKSQEKRKC